MHKDFNEYYEQVKRKYYELGYVYSPALKENVYFDKHGFIHLSRKGRELRPINDRVRRLGLVLKSIQIIKTESQISTYRIDTYSGLTIHFWSIETRIENKLIRVIIRKKNQGRAHFFSIMDK